MRICALCNHLKAVFLCAWCLRLSNIKNLPSLHHLWPSTRYSMIFQVIGSVTTWKLGLLFVISYCSCWYSLISPGLHTTGVARELLQHGCRVGEVGSQGFNHAAVFREGKHPNWPSGIGRDAKNTCWNWWFSIATPCLAEGTGITWGSLLAFVRMNCLGLETWQTCRSLKTDHWVSSKELDSTSWCFGDCSLVKPYYYAICFSCWW